MGVAGLFAFLRRKYPLIVEPCDQQAAGEGEGEDGFHPGDAAMCDILYIGQWTVPACYCCDHSILLFGPPANVWENGMQPARTWAIETATPGRGWCWHVVLHSHHLQTRLVPCLGRVLKSRT
jgi:hypothetical protein